MCGPIACLSGVHFLTGDIIHHVATLKDLAINVAVRDPWGVTRGSVAMPYIFNNMATRKLTQDLLQITLENVMHKA